MAGTTTKLLLPYPQSTDNNNVPSDILALANRLDAVPGIETLTTVARNALASAQKWDGRVIFNSTTLALERYRVSDTSWRTISVEDLFTAQGDTVYATGAGVMARLAKGTGLQYYRMNAGATAPEWAAFPTIPTQAVFYEVHTWAIGGVIAVPSGDTNFIIPMSVGKGASETVVLDKVRYFINSGTSATFKMQVNGSDATGFTGISATTTAATTDPADVTLADLDKLVPVVTAVSASPTNLSITAVLKHTVTLS